MFQRVILICLCVQLVATGIKATIRSTVVHVNYHLSVRNQKDSVSASSVLFLGMIVSVVSERGKLLPKKYVSASNL